MFPPCNSGIHHFSTAFERRARDLHGTNLAFKMSREKLGGARERWRANSKPLMMMR
jgi:hypothetical protein